MRGDQLFEGYHHNPEATAAAIVDGWFHSGDIGYAGRGRLPDHHRTQEGNHRDGGRQERRARGARGSPARLTRSCPKCVVVGDGKPFIGALITIDAEALPGWLKSQRCLPG